LFLADDYQGQIYNYFEDKVHGWWQIR